MQPIEPAVLESWHRLVMSAAEATLEQLRSGLGKHPDLLREIARVCIVVEDDAPEDDPDLLGCYLGVPITEGEPVGALPPLIELYLLPLVDLATPDILNWLDPNEQELSRQVRITVLHEIGHHLGIEHERMDELGLL